MSHAKLITYDPDILGGTAVFVGTRVPVKTLFDYVKAGQSIYEFLTDFPSVSAEQVVALFDQIIQRLQESPQ